MDWRGGGVAGPVPDAGRCWAVEALRMLDTMLLVTPTTSNTTQTISPTSCIAASYLVPGTGGGWPSAGASVEAPIEERISVSA